MSHQGLKPWSAASDVSEASASLFTTNNIIVSIILIFDKHKFNPTCSVAYVHVIVVVGPESEVQGPSGLLGAVTTTPLK